MELTFNKVGKQYEAEFQLSADANLHIEFESAAPVKLYQRTTGSGWDLVSDVKNAVGKATDVDLTSLIYPKFVKVVCVQEPTYATVTTDGEITEIKSQSKEVEVTANGTMDITPDAGFSYLNSVKVKTNVPTSGGGGSASSWRYFSAPTITDQFVASTMLYSLAHIVRTNSSSGTQIGSIFLYQGEATLDAVGIDTSRVVYLNGMTPEPMQIEALFAMENGGVTFEQMLVQMLGISEITEEEFYNLNA